MIYDFINDICNILNIPTPSVSFDTSNFSTDTMMAQCSPDGSTIYIKKYDKPNPDQLFSIAHELRHVWQIQNDEQFYLSTSSTNAPSFMPCIPISQPGCVVYIVIIPLLKSL